MVDTANAAGGVDNITVVVVAVTGDDPAGNGEATGDAAAGLLPFELSATEAPPAEARLVDEPELAAAPDGDATSRRARRRAERREERGPRDRGRTVKTVLWVGAVVAVIAIAFGAVAWYARNTYYVAFAGENVTVYKGVPGGLLVWDPTVEHRTGLTRSDLRAVDAAAVHDEKTFSSRADADAFVRRLRDHADVAATSTTSPVTTTTTPASTTTVPTTTTVAGP